MVKDYNLSAKEMVACLIKYVGIIALLSYLFYDSVLGLFAMMPFVFFYIKYEKSNYCRKYKEELDREFIKSLQSLTTSLAAGFSPENAFIETQKDMERLYGAKAIICRELAKVNRQISLGKRIEEALNDFSDRTGSQNIRDFSLVFLVAKESGGDFTKVISSCVDIMETQNKTKEETNVLISGKQYEQKIMSIVPMGILTYLRISSGSFIEILYHNITGVIVMTICLLIYLSSIVLARRICQRNS